MDGFKPDDGGKRVRHLGLSDGFVSLSAPRQGLYFTPRWFILAGISMKKTVVKSEDAAAFIAHFRETLHVYKDLLGTARDGAVNGSIEFCILPKRTEFPKKK